MTGQRQFKEPVLVPHAEAARFLWGDEDSHHVADLGYGRGDQYWNYGDRPAEFVFAVTPRYR
jgi:hypothetical protein